MPECDSLQYDLNLKFFRMIFKFDSHGPQGLPRHRPAGWIGDAARRPVDRKVTVTGQSRYLKLSGDCTHWQCIPVTVQAAGLKARLPG